MEMKLILFCLLMCILEKTEGKVVEKRNAPKDINEYLTSFGYLAPANLETGALRSTDELTRAVKNLQKMAGVPINGDPDDPELQSVLAKDRCGVSDRKVNQDPSTPQSFQVSNHKWENRLVKYKILSFSNDMDRGEQKRKFFDAFDIWHQVADISFQEVGANDEADIVITFDRYDHGDGYPLDGAGNVLAHAFPPGPGRGGDAHFDEDELWSSRGSPEGSTDLYTVAAHEFGHSLGIYHSEKKGALMYPWYQGYNENLRLEYDDVMAIQTLYGAPSSNRKTDKPIKFSFATYPATRPVKSTPSPRVPQKPDGINPPDPCTTTIDDVVLIRSNTFAFKDKWYWRFDAQGQLMADQANENKLFWNGLPVDQAINAVTDIPKIDITIFFIGKKYWLLRARDMLPGFPKEGRDIAGLGIETKYVDHIDAAMVWGYNQRVYIFSGDIYWRLSNSSMHMTKSGNNLKVDEGYPKSFDLWEGIPVPIDGAYSNNKGETFFFKGTQYWGFDDVSMRAKTGYPQDIAKMLNCVYGLTAKGGAVTKLSSYLWLLVTIFVSQAVLRF